MGGGPSSSSGSSSSGAIPSECYKQAHEEFNNRYASPATFQLSYRDFQIIRPLGRGAFGSVKEVKCVRDPPPDYLQTTNSADPTSKSYRIALKIINKKSAHKMKQEEHVVNEKRILQALNFPFIIRFYFSFKDNANLYIGLELIEGGELFRHLRDQERFDERKAKFYASQIILALEYLHLLGIVYRDLKVRRRL
jgi:protein kinase A